MQDENTLHRVPEPGDPSADAADVFSRESLERIVAYLEGQIEDLDRREGHLNSELACLDSDRRALRLQVQQFEQRVEQQDANLAEREEDVAQGESAQQLLRLQLLQEQKNVAHDRTQLTSEQAELLKEQSTWREQFEREFAEQRQELELRDTQINRRTVDVEKRARFHEEHLEKLRRELDRQRSELTAAAQQQQMSREAMETQIRRRLAQIRRYRELIEQRDAATRTQRDALLVKERQHAQDAAERFELLSRERTRLEEQCSARHAELERQAGRLKAKELGLEQRASRLEVAREELQRSQRECTESRAAAELAWNQLCEAVGSQGAGERLEEQRRELDEQLQAWERGNSDRLNELQQAVEELRKERVACRESAAARLERLARREEAVRELEAAVGRALARLAERLRTVSRAERPDDDSSDAAQTLDDLEATVGRDQTVGETGSESDAA